MSTAGLIAALPMAPPGEGEFSATQSYSSGVWHLIEYSLAVAGFALFAGAVYSFMGRNEVGAKYKEAVHASALLQSVAALAYLALFISWNSSFVYQNGAFVPAPDTLFSGGLRYADWSVTVPLLSVELLAVTTLVGKNLGRYRGIAIGAAFLMIVTGFTGASVIANGTSTSALNIWGIISTVFFIVLYAVLGKAVLDSRSGMSTESFTSLLRATIVLFAIFGAYPLLYIVQVIVGPGNNLVLWAVVVQVGFSFSDVIAKVGFGAMIHKVAKLRTAEDVAAGTATHEESIFVDHEERAPARPALAGSMAGGAGNGTSPGGPGTSGTPGSVAGGAVGR